MGSHIGRKAWPSGSEVRAMQKAASRRGIRGIGGSRNKASGGERWWAGSDHHVNCKYKLCSNHRSRLTLILLPVPQIFCTSGDSHCDLSSSGRERGTSGVGRLLWRGTVRQASTWQESVDIAQLKKQDLIMTAVRLGDGGPQNTC